VGLRLAIVLAVAACAGGPSSQPQPVPTPPPVIVTPPVDPPAPVDPGGPIPGGAINFRSSGDASFDAWRQAFSDRALREGRERRHVVSILSGLTPPPPRETVQAAAADQPEFTKPIWEYVNSAMSTARVNTGRDRLATTGVLGAIEDRHGVPRELLVSIWGMETSYGRILGTTDVPQALATMAWEGRRRGFAERELMALLRMLEEGKVVREQLKGSWAGAMGQTQFMPSTFLAYAVDWEGDGRKDLWTSAADALGSAANYVRASGWRTGEPWGFEVTLPEGFDYALTDGTARPADFWRSVGVRPASGADLPALQSLAELFAPAGSHGPVFLLTQNFNVIKRYNNADSYALAVGMLGDAVAGRPGLVKAWPVGLRLLTMAETRDLQGRLTALGYDTRGVDGVAGRNTRAALQRFQRDRGLMADGYPTVEMLAAVRAATP
jgi:membrane-bound lytic murein transglycosylase B